MATLRRIQKVNSYCGVIFENLEHDKTLKEISDIKNNPIEGITVEPQEVNLFEWKCTIKGAVRQLLSFDFTHPHRRMNERSFGFSLSLPPNFPFKAPTVTFITRIYHPGINEEGAICVPVLRDEWKPTVTLSSVLQTIKEKVNNPSADDPFEPDIAAVLKNDRAKFNQTAKEWIKKYASA